MLKTIVIRRGAKHVIRAIAFTADNGGRDRCETLGFFQEHVRKNPSEMTKLAALLSESAEKGPPKNLEKFRSLPGTDLYEFKTSGGLRLICFWDDQGLIISTHGYIKSSQKAPKPELSHATNLQRRYLEAKKNNTLIHGK